MDCIIVIVFLNCVCVVLVSLGLDFFIKLVMDGLVSVVLFILM